MGVVSFCDCLSIVPKPGQKGCCNLSRFEPLSSFYFCGLLARSVYFWSPLRTQVKDAAAQGGYDNSRLVLPADFFPPRFVLVQGRLLPLLIRVFEQILVISFDNLQLVPQAFPGLDRPNLVAGAEKFGQPIFESGPARVQGQLRRLDMDVLRKARDERGAG